MARFTNGWVKINRDLLDERWDGNKRYVFMTLMLMANYQEGNPTIRKGQRFVLNKGQVMTSLNELARMLDIAKSTVHRNLEFLKEMGEIWYTSDTLGTIITLINYSFNRDFEDNAERQRDTNATASATTREYCIEEVKKLRIKEGVGADALPPDLDRFLFAYEQAYLGKYTFSPIVNRAGRAAAKRVIADLGIDGACKLVEAYLKIGNDPYFYSRSYDLVTFEANILAIQKFVETKSHMTLIELKAIERDAKKGPKL